MAVNIMHTREYPAIDMQTTGQNIQRLRMQSGLSVSDLQRYFGFEAPQAIYKWQRGETIPSIDNLIALSWVFNVKVEDILITVKNREECFTSTIV